MTSSTPRPDPSAQSIGGVHKGRVYVYAFIGVCGVRVVTFYDCIVFLKKKSYQALRSHNRKITIPTGNTWGVKRIMFFKLSSSIKPIYIVSTVYKKMYCVEITMVIIPKACNFNH